VNKNDANIIGNILSN